MITPDKTLALPERAVIFSFEGPDPYSMVGGLGSRVTELAQALGAAGVATDLFFIGDPNRPPVEDIAPNVRLRRWGQWISDFHRGGVYDGELAKRNDFTASAPGFVAEELISRAAREGSRVLVLAEEWHTAPATVVLDGVLRARGLRDTATIFWNANNTYGFDVIDWATLRRAATITTVSKYMKFELDAHGVPSLVIPNGIPARSLAGPNPEDVRSIRAATRGRPLLVKVGRYDPDKRWMQAIDALAELRAAGRTPQLIIRGGREPYGDAILTRAREQGSRIVDVTFSAADPRELFRGLAQSEADVVNLRSFLPEPLLAALYAAADAVLANSGKEPFGLVGLEVMAAGGLPVCGATGEEYAEPFVNAIVCDTDDGRELATYLQSVTDNERLVADMKRAARATAARYTWESVLGVLARKVSYVEAKGAQ
jgi:glycosyltransferase involved in cell wall biosynthesis